ncbi:MAG TPA: YfhO family protein, partial [Verrucomicrobiae bacterium]
FFRDFGLFGFPLAHYARESFWRGEVPLWNPLSDCGIPFLAQWNTMTLYPPMLFCYIFPLPWALSVFNLGHLFLGGMGMYALARHHTKSQLAGAMAGVLFAFNGLALNCLMWPNNIAALGWMPWVLLFVQRAWRNGGRSLIPAVLAASFQMLAGAPEMIFFTWLMVSAFALQDITASERGKRMTLVRRFLAIIFCTTALCAVQLFPFLEFLRQSHRESLHQTSQWALPLSGWMNFFVPLINSKPSFYGVSAQEGQFWTSSIYPGLIALVLAGAALRSPKKIWPLVFLALGGLWMSFGEKGFLFEWVSTVFPPISSMRYPIKWIVLLSFAVPLLASHGLVWLTCPVVPLETQRKTICWAAVLCSTVVIGITGCSLAVGHHAQGLEALIVNASQRIILLLAICVLLFVISGKFKLRVTCALAAFSLITLDFYQHVPWQNPTAPPSAFATAAVDSLLPATATKSINVRAAISPAANQVLRFSWLEDPAQHYLSRRTALFSNCNLLEGIAKLDGFYSMYPRHYADLVLQLYSTTNQISAPLLDYLGVAAITSKELAFDWTPRTTALSFISGGQKTIELQDAQALKILLSDNFNPREQLVLPASHPSLGISAANVAIHLQKQSAHILKFEVQADAPSIISIAQSWSPNWKASVNAKPTPLLRANYAFQAIQVPQGHSVVQLRYQDSAFKYGLVISLLTCLGLLGAGLTGVPAPPSNLIRQTKIKRCPLLWFAFALDHTSQNADRLIDDGQSHACTWKLFGGMQSLKWPEEFVSKLHVESATVVPHKKPALPLALNASELKYRCGPPSSKFPRVPEQMF